MTTASWRDTPEQYGLVSRGFHWVMAALFAWQFAGALLYVGIGDTAVTRLVGGSHLTLGFTLFVLVLLRGLWGLANLKRRPPHPGRHGRAAVIGHGAIYALMIVIPSLALLRQYGSGKPFTPYGLQLMPGRDSKIEWMMVPADLFHYWLGFTLLAVDAVGHVVVRKAFAPLIGLPCWGAQRGQGSMLSFEFGPPYLRITEPHVSTSSVAWIRQRATRRRVRPCGAWHLFIFCCHWRIAVSGETVAEDESPADRIEAAAQAIDGQKLTAFALDATTRTTTFAFDLGARLTTWPYEGEINEPWSLYLPDGQVLAYRSDGCRSLGAADEEPDRHVWMPVGQNVRVP